MEHSARQEIGRARCPPRWPRVDPVTSLVDRVSSMVRESVDRVWREAAKFGVVGAIAFVIDVGGFNLLFHGPLSGRLTSSRVI